MQLPFTFTERRESGELSGDLAALSGDLRRVARPPVRRGLVLKEVGEVRRPEAAAVGGRDELPGAGHVAREVEDRGRRAAERGRVDAAAALKRGKRSVSCCCR